MQMDSHSHSLSLLYMPLGAILLFWLKALHSEYNVRCTLCEVIFFPLDFFFKLFSLSQNAMRIFRNNYQFLFHVCSSLPFKYFSNTILLRCIGNDIQLESNKNSIRVSNKLSVDNWKVQLKKQEIMIEAQSHRDMHTVEMAEMPKRSPLMET